jgi:hypothetical protein
MLQWDASFLRQFSTWAGVVTYMRGGTSRDPMKDEVLRPILAAHHADQDPRWRKILLVIFWPGLNSLHRQRIRWDPDPEDLWQNLVWVFHEVVCRIDPARRPDRLVQKVINDTAHHLHDEYHRRWDASLYEVAQDGTKLETLAGGADGVDLDAIERRQARRAAIRTLKDYVAEGVLTEPDFFLIVGTRIYGRPLKDFAARAGLDYQVVKKRRQRAEAALRRKASRTCPLASPTGAFPRQGRKRAPGRSEPR